MHSMMPTELVNLIKVVMLTELANLINRAGFKQLIHQNQADINSKALESFFLIRIYFPPNTP